ncbi:MAG: class I SAM-dependent methyltransferase [Phaeodactylibacter sp.]|nr:class I SAM-dependent methyltransferase [Phaeodactylibacter sp.]
MANTQIRSIEEQNRAIERYYQLQSRIYNATRWAFLFGRRRVIRALPFPIEKRAQILEVGCGAGHNLRQLARWFPNACITGLDVSSRMISKAAEATAPFWNRVELVQEPYGYGSGQFRGKMDAILFSYSLTMANPQWREFLFQAQEDLKPGGYIAVVDFHDSRFPWFRAHMANRHVRMDGHLLPFLNKEFEPLSSEVQPAYRGLWEYFSFVGRKK